MKSLWNTIKALHRDEQGADMVEYILIVAAIALPLMGVAVWFWKDVKAQAISWWDAIKGDTPVGVGPGQ